MSDFKVTRLLPADEEELDAAAKLFEKVMAEDDMTLALIGSDKTKAFAMHRAALGGAALAGEIYVCTHKDLGMVSAAIWFGPGREFYDSDEQREAGFNDLFRTFPQELQQWWLGYFLPKFSEATTKALGEEVKKDAWHLQLIAVLPEHQGKGIGTALVKPVFERAVSQGKSVCLETNVKKNVGLYEHWGFSVEEEADLESSTDAGAFHIWDMLKRPPSE